MQLHSFQSYSMEWWHFTHKKPSAPSSGCPILNIPVQDVAGWGLGSNRALTKGEESALIQRLLEGMAFKDTQQDDDDDDDDGGTPVE